MGFHENEVTIISRNMRPSRILDFAVEKIGLGSLNSGIYEEVDRMEILKNGAN